MSVTTVPFDLIAWCERMGALRGSPDPITQVEAARLLGLTLIAYKAAERRCRIRPGTPCTLPMALLAQRVEDDERRQVRLERAS